MNQLPNANRLRKLPLRALVAYATRCAMRAQLLFLNWQEHEEAGDVLAHMAEAVSEAINLTSEFANARSFDERRGQELEETLIDFVMRVKDRHRGAAFATNSAYAALNAANLAQAVDPAKPDGSGAEDVLLAVITAADAAIAAHQPICDAAINDFLTMELMRWDPFPQAGRAIDPSGEGSLGPLFKKKSTTSSWKDQSSGLKQIKKAENVLEQTREELRFQQQERKREQSEHETQCDEYEKTIRHLRAEVIPLKKERDGLKATVAQLEEKLNSLEGSLALQAESYRKKLSEFAHELLSLADAEPEVTPQPIEVDVEEASVEKEPSIEEPIQGESAVPEGALSS